MGGVFVNKQHLFSLFHQNVGAEQFTCDFPGFRLQRRRFFLRLLCHRSRLWGSGGRRGRSGLDLVYRLLFARRRLLPHHIHRLGRTGGCRSLSRLNCWRGFGRGKIVQGQRRPRRLGRGSDERAVEFDLIGGDGIVGFGFFQYRRGMAPLPGKCIEHRVVHSGKDLPLVGKLDLRLGGVYVHVHHVQLRLQMEHTTGKLAHHALIGIGLLQRGGHNSGFYIASVNKKVLIVSAALAAHGQGGKAGHGHVLSTALYFLKSKGKVSAQNCVNGRLEPSVPGSKQFLFPVPDELDAHLRVGQGQTLDHGKDRRPLGGVLFHKLEPGRGVEEQVTHHHGCPFGAARLLHSIGNPSLQRQGRSKGRAGGTGHYVDAGHGADCGQSLATEAQGADGLQIILGAQFAGGVAQKCGRQLIRLHAAPVIGHTDKGHAAVCNFHRHLFGSGVDGVFHQLLGHAGRTLHHLTGGDQVGHMGF